VAPAPDLLLFKSLPILNWEQLIVPKVSDVSENFNLMLAECGRVFATKINEASNQSTRRWLLVGKFWSGIWGSNSIYITQPNMVIRGSFNSIRYANRLSQNTPVLCRAGLFRLGRVRYCVCQNVSCHFGPAYKFFLQRRKLLSPVAVEAIELIKLSVKSS